MKPTAAQERRIRELFKLIADEKDSEKVQVLAGELARLLTVQAPLRKPSDQQLRIIELVAQGLKNREIADEIGLSRNVVRNYVGEIYREAEEGTAPLFLASSMQKKSFNPSSFHWAA